MRESGPRGIGGGFGEAAGGEGVREGASLGGLEAGPGEGRRRVGGGLRLCGGGTYFDRPIAITNRSTRLEVKTNTKKRTRHTK